MLSIGNNSRIEWSRITDTRILRPGDELKLLGERAMATVAVLDSHDPQAYLRSRGISWRDIPGQEVEPLGDHHHILVQLDGSAEVLAAGLHRGEGGSGRLFIKHLTPSQQREAGYGERLDRLRIALGAGIHGIYFMSDQERLTALPEARPYLDPNGALLR